MNRKHVVNIGDNNVEIKSKTACYILRDHYVLIKPYFCGICGSDLHAYHKPTTGICCGHEITGIVKKVGDKVTNCHIGNKVTINPLIHCQNCYFCRKGQYTLCSNLQIIGVTIDGGLTNKLMVPEHAVFVIESINLEAGILTEPVAVMVKVCGLLNFSDYDKNILIFGCGTLGLLAILVAHESNIKHLSIIAKHSFQQEKAKEISEKLGININIFDANDRTRIKNIKPDIIIETVGGSATTFKDSVEIIKPGGKIVVAGIFSENSPPIDPFLLVTKNLTIFGSNCYNKYNYNTAIHILKKYGNFIKDIIITHKFKIKDSQLAFKVASNKITSRCVKCIIQIN